MSHIDHDNPPVRLVREIEGLRALDNLDAVLRPVGKWLVADPLRRDLLQGRWLGHALHPLLTDLPLGLWTSASVLDLVGGATSRPAAQRLLGLGVLAAIPTAVTGHAELAALTGLRERRTAALHAVLNGAAVVSYAASWRARARGSHGTGVLLGLSGAALSGAAGYLGGHLVSARKVSTRHPAYDAE